MKKLMCVGWLMCCGYAVQAAPVNTGVTYNMVSLSESATRSVERDQMTVNLEIWEEGRDPAVLTPKVTEKINTVLNLAKTNKALSVMLSGRNSSRFISKNDRETWRETATINITGRDFVAINQLLSQVQSVAHIQSVQFSVSRKKREQLDNELTVEALTRLKARAKLIAQTMGLSQFRVVSIDVGDNSSSFPVVEARYRLNQSVNVMAKAAPVAEAAPGTQDVSLRVSAQVQMY